MIGYFHNKNQHLILQDSFIRDYVVSCSSLEINGILVTLNIFFSSNN